MIEPTSLTPLPHPVSFLHLEDEDGDSVSTSSSLPPPPASEFEAVQQQGFYRLRFPADLESRFHIDKSDERLKLQRTGIFLSVLLSFGMLAPDWMMVPDQFGLAAQLRLLAFSPFLALTAWLLPRLPLVWREWIGLTNSLLAASIIVALCLNSQDPLGPPYLVSLSLILLFNGGVVRTRFWLALTIDSFIMLMFGLAIWSLPNPNVPVMTGVALIMVSTTVFTLYSSYWLEHEERINWLMLKHEHLLADKLERGNRRMDRLTRFDPLTEIANRRHFDEFLDQVWARARRSGHEVALLMMDIDHFKLYNDHYGHLAGDECLRRVAQLLQGTIRRADEVAARYGGEEFVLLLPDVPLPEAVTVAERCMASLREAALAHPRSPTAPYITASMGIASLVPRPGTSSDTLVHAADAALYRAKYGGRNRFEVFTPPQ